MFVKKVVTIAATQYNQTGDHPAVQMLLGTPMLVTKYGPLKVEVGDWIITDPDGNGYYPCKDEAFKKLYEEYNGT